MGNTRSTEGQTISSMECAAAEAFFLTGVERNQDIVTLSAYAPLLQNVNYSAWRPNLIAFDNHRAYGIPTYHMLSMMAQNRGKEVVEVHLQVEEDCPAYHGIPGLLCEKPGLQFRNAKVNGRSVEISRTVYGAAESDGGVFTTREKRGQTRFTYESALWAEKMEAFQKQRMRQHGAPDTDGMMYFAFGEADERCYTFEIDLKFDPDNPVTLSVWNYHPETDAGVEEPKDFGWNLFSVTRQVWGLYDGEGVTEDTRYRMRFRQQPGKPRGVKLDIDYTRFNTYKIVTRPDGYDCYIDGVLVQSADLRKYPAVAATASVDGDTVIVKIVNISNTDREVRIELDCEVAAKGQAQVLTGRPDAVNTLDDPERVCVMGKTISGAARRFSYGAPACSVSVLRLKKA